MIGKLKDLRKAFRFCKILFLILIVSSLSEHYIFQKKYQVKPKLNKKTFPELNISSIRNQSYLQSEIESQLLSRKKQIKSNCIKNKLNDSMSFDSDSLKSDFYPWLFLSHKYKLAYCQTPKVGSTSWLNLFKKMQENLIESNEELNVHSHHFLTLFSLNETERAKVFRSYKKFLIVREPLERLRSAYKDKLFPHLGKKRPVFASLARQIVDYYRGDQSHFQFEFDKNFPTFREFIHFLTIPKKDLNLASKVEMRHWLPQTQLCQPCNIDYDYIMELKNINQESDYILNSAGVPNRIRLDKSNSPLQNVSKLHYKLKQEFYMETDRNDISAVYEYYKEDYDILGYKYPNDFLL